MTKVPSSYLGLVIGQPVRVKAHPQQPRSDWKPGVILENIAPRSHLVEVNARTYRRNRVHLRVAVQSQTDSLPVQEPDPAQTPGLRTNLLTMIPTRLQSAITQERPINIHVDQYCDNSS